jgi:hypothetical protein
MIRFHTLACGLLLALSVAPCLGATPSAGGPRPRASIEVDQTHALRSAVPAERLSRTPR